jgi:hypothetical protein
VQARDPQSPFRARFFSVPGIRATGGCRTLLALPVLSLEGSVRRVDFKGAVSSVPVLTRPNLSSPGQLVRSGPVRFHRGFGLRGVFLEETI